MNTSRQDKGVIEQINRQLDDSVDALDARTLSRLNQARQRATDARLTTTQKLYHHWVIPGVFTAILIAMGAVWLSDMPGSTSPVNDYSISYGDYELIDDLDFINWLSVQDEAG